MKDQINFAENTPADADRQPSLQRAGNPPRDAIWRILQQLEHGSAMATAATKSPHWNNERWIVRLGLLIALICASAWYLHPRPARSKAQTTAPAVPLPPASSQSNRAAQIIHAPASAQVAELPPPAAAAAAVTGPPASRHDKAALHKGLRPAVPADRIAASDPAEAPPDRDAALLAALVAHGSSGHTGATTINRDIVERQASDSTQHLLQRCQQLGMIEGMLCRSRICAGRWDSDPACRQPDP